MVLRPDVLERLRGMPGAVADDDFQRTYAFTHPMNAAQRLRSNHPLPGPDGVQWQIELFDATGTPLCDGWLARNAYCSHPLVASRGRGAVARNARFVLSPTFRRRGVATALYASEETLYRRWGIREIHITAQQDGPVVWVRGFGFRLAD